VTPAQTEILVVGSGAGGAVTAATLAQAGRTVTVIEEGQHVDPTAYAQFSQAEMLTKYRHGGVNATLGVPPVAYVEGCCVGGGTEINSGLYHRTPSAVIDDWRRGWGVVDLTPETLQPYAARVEAALSVSTLPGAPPRTSRVLVDGAAALDWKAVEVPRVFRFEAGETDHRHGVKQTMTRTFLPLAVEHGARIESGVRVVRLVIDGGRVRGAVCQPTGGGPRERFTVVADEVFVCAGAVQTPALLQRSGIRDNVGRQFKVHPTMKLAGRFADPFDDQSGIPMHQVTEFSPEFHFGGSVSRPGYVALALSDCWERNAADIEFADRIAVYYAAIRSNGSGRIRALPGLTAPVVTYRLTDADLSRLARSLVQLGQLLFAAGADRLYPSITGMPPLRAPKDLVLIWDAVQARRANLMTIHLFSSVPMGEMRSRTGTDSFGRVWDVENLRINDASLLPDAPGVNPQGTIMAIAMRNAEHFLSSR
jgi:choline dehydrogenase-like flavoprotein